MMTLNDSIQYCYEIVDKLKDNNCKCAEKHLQLAHWLEEFKELKTKDNIRKAMIKSETILSAGKNDRKVIVQGMITSIAYQSLSEIVLEIHLKDDDAKKAIKALGAGSSIVQIIFNTILSEEFDKQLKDSD